MEFHPNRAENLENSGKKFISALIFQHQSHITYFATFPAWNFIQIGQKIWKIQTNIHQCANFPAAKSHNIFWDISGMEFHPNRAENLENSGKKFISALIFSIKFT